MKELSQESLARVARVAQEEAVALLWVEMGLEEEAAAEVLGGAVAKEARVVKQVPMWLGLWFLEHHLSLIMCRFWWALEVLEAQAVLAVPAAWAAREGDLRVVKAPDVWEVREEMEA